jgi:hypothetical protein
MFNLLFYGQSNFYDCATLQYSSDYYAKIGGIKIIYVSLKDWYSTKKLLPKKKHAAKLFRRARRTSSSARKKVQNKCT